MNNVAECCMMDNDAKSTKVFKYPVKNLKFFYFGTQREAIKKFEENVNEFFLFSFEVAVGGSRRYLVCTADMFWTNYQEVTKKNYYEVICEKSSTKLYCDIEFDKQSNNDKDGYEMIQMLQNVIFLKLKMDHGIVVNQEDCLVLESSDSRKFSIHLVFYTVVFKTNKDCGLFMKQVLDDLPENTRSIFEVKAAGKNGNYKKSFIDLSVYSSVQQIRMFESSKFGQSRPFKVSEIDTSTEALVKNQSIEDGAIRKEVFLRSLITHTNQKEGKIISISSPRPRNHPNKKGDFMIREINSKFEASFVRNEEYHINIKPRDGEFVKSVQSRAEQTNLQVIEGFLREKVYPGQIWKKKPFNEEGISFYVKNFSFCEKIGREHSSKNHIYFIYYDKIQKLEQGCFSRGCRHLANKQINVKL